MERQLERPQIEASRRRKGEEAGNSDSPNNTDTYHFVRVWLQYW